MNTGIQTMPSCGYCGRPVVGFANFQGGVAYHPECCHGPDYGKNIYPAPVLTEERIRQIIREELSHAK